MSIYGATANAVQDFRRHQRLNSVQAEQLASEPITQTDSTAELMERAVRLDRIKQYLDFANEACAEILGILKNLQP
jgi:hypothetical protein